MTTMKGKRFFSVFLHWDTLFLFYGGNKMRQTIAWILILMVVLCGCSNKQGVNKSGTTAQTENSDLPFDKDGIYYKDNLQKSLDETDIGDIYWDYNADAYSIRPRGNFRTSIIMLAADPFNEKLISYWDTTLEYIASLSKIYPCSICVINPSNASTYLAIVNEGEIGYSAF